MEKNYMDEACSAYGERRVLYRVFGEESLREKDHQEEIVVDGRIILR